MPRTLGQSGSTPQAQNTNSMSTPSYRPTISTFKSPEPVQEESKGFFGSIAEGAKNLGSAIIKPAVEYGKFLGEAGAQGVRAITDPTMRKAVFNPGAMTTEDYEKLGQLQQTYFVDPKDIATRGDIALTGAKRTAGAAAYAIPGAGAGVAKTLAAGTASGALTGFSESEKGKELEGTLVGGGTGLVTAGVLKGAEKVAGAGARATGKVLTKVGKLGASMAKEAVRDLSANEVYKSAFVIPRKIQERLNLDNMATELINDGVSGNMDELIKVSNKVTGNDGIITRAVRSMLGSIKGQIDTNEALTAATAAADDALNLDDRVIGKTMKKITRMISSRQGELPGKTSAIDVWDVVKSLEDEGYGLINKSTDLSPNPALEQQGKIFLDAADALKSQIDMAQIDQNLFNQLKTKYAEELQKISPNLAKKIQNAQTLSEVRAIAKPYVDLNQAAKLTLANKNTAFGKMLSGDVGPDLTKPFSLIKPFTEREGVKTGFLAPFAKKLSQAGEVVSNTNTGVTNTLIQTGQKIPATLKPFTDTVNRTTPVITSQYAVN